MNIKAAINKDFLILDGAMGTQIQKMDLRFSHSPEELNLTDAEAITAIHGGYVHAGAEVVYTNTFQANGYKLTKGLSLKDVIFAAVKNARLSGAKYIALDVGPTGRLIEPMGDMSCDEAYAIFKEVAELGASAGVDLICLETFTSLAEARMALLAVKESTSLPVFCTMSYDGMRTMSGAGVANEMLTLSALGADAVGFNCSMGADEMLPLVEEAVKWTNLPIIAKPNAGLPNGKTYSAAEFATSMGKLIDAGASIVGGCCGTSPEYIEELKKVLCSKTFVKRHAKIPAAVCNESTVVTLDGLKTVGERINPTGKKAFRQALLNGSYCDYAKAEAVAQKAAGAELLDVNCGLPEVDEKVILPELVKSVQGELPLMIDTSDGDALQIALRYYCGVAVVNSVNGDEESISTILPQVKKYGAYVIALCLDAGGIKSCAQSRSEIAKRIISAGKKRFGIDKDRFIVDTLTLSVATAKNNATDCLDTLRAMKKKQIKTALGVSNVSFGLPNRGIINSAFLAMAAREGLTLAIVNPLVQEVGDAIKSAKLLLGGDVNAYMSGEHQAEAPATKRMTEVTLEYAIENGMKTEAKEATTALLQKGITPQEIIDKHLIVALDAVGKGYESGRLFLPELMSSADTAKVAFDVIKNSMSGEKAQSKGKILLATVKGDIHDIGKNIVKALLENYGYLVLDLGKDVPKSIIVKTAMEEQVGLVGLSALMTTTARSMAETVAELKAAGYGGKIMVGGAVITEEFAKSIGADFYAKDANASANIAKKIFN